MRVTALFLFPAFLIACEPSTVSQEGETCETILELKCNDGEVLRCNVERLLTVVAECSSGALCALNDAGEDWTCVEESGAGAFCNAATAPAGVTVSACGGEANPQKSRLECRFGKLELDVECAFACKQYALEHFGAAYTRGFCVEENGAGDFCGDELSPAERCVGQDRLGCSGETWTVLETCAAQDSCKEYPHKSYCVQPNGLGDYCERGDTKEKPHKQCVANAVHVCDPTSKEWTAGDVCGEGKECAESVKPDDTEFKDAGCVTAVP